MWTDGDGVGLQRANRPCTQEHRPREKSHPSQKHRSFPVNRTNLDSRAIGAGGESTDPPQDGGFVKNAFSIQRMNRVVSISPKQHTLLCSFGCSAAQVP